MITFISGQYGKSALANDLANDLASRLRDDFKPSGYIFHEGATEQEIICKAKEYKNVIICCPHDFPKNISFPARYIHIPLWIEADSTAAINQPVPDANSKEEKAA